MKKTICFDIDNTICKMIKSNYKNSKPIAKNINCITEEFYFKYFFETRFRPF
jgi:hypothetical protein